MSSFFDELLDLGMDLLDEFDGEDEHPAEQDKKPQARSRAQYQSAEAQDGKFTDDEFPPCDDSIWTPQPTFSEDGTASFDSSEVEKADLVWMRPEEFFQDEEYHMFEDKIEPNDINQGALGNCWFLCSIACLAEFPQLIRKLFQEDSQELNDYGLYNITLCIDGQWRNYSLDDLMPCTSDNHSPQFARANHNELWVMLLEKAYAKACGSYWATALGWPYEALINMTGAPYSTITFKSEKGTKMLKDGSMWTMLRDNDAKGYLQTASTGGTDNLTLGGDRTAKGAGIVPGHAYAVLQVRETSGGLKLLQLRNPWGKDGMEWNGDYSDHSPLWTDELREELGYFAEDVAEDGIFWMNFHDFCTYYNSADCVMIKHGGNGEQWYEYRQPLTFRRDDEGEVQAPVFVLNVSERVEEAYFSVHQRDTRCIDAMPYIDFGVTVLQQVGNKFKLLRLTRNFAQRQNQTGCAALEPGKYLVVPTSMLNEGCSDEREVTLVVHGSSSFAMSEQNKPKEAVKIRAEALRLAIELLGTDTFVDQDDGSGSGSAAGRGVGGGMGGAGSKRSQSQPRETMSGAQLVGQVALGVLVWLLVWVCALYHMVFNLHMYHKFFSLFP